MNDSPKYDKRGDRRKNTSNCIVDSSPNNESDTSKQFFFHIKISDSLLKNISKNSCYLSSTEQKPSPNFNETSMLYLCGINNQKLVKQTRETEIRNYTVLLKFFEILGILTQNQSS